MMDIAIMTPGGDHIVGSGSQNLSKQNPTRLCYHFILVRVTQDQEKASGHFTPL